MDIESCYQIGYVIKRHGLKGDIKIHLDEPLPKKLESIFVEIDNRLIPFFIEHISILKDQAIVKFEDISSADQADKLTKSRIFLPLALRKKTSPGTLEYKDLVGFSVYFDTDKLGTVSSINDHALNPLLVIPGRDKEILIPISDYFVKEIDEKKKVIHVELPDGFLDI